MVKAIWIEVALGDQDPPTIDEYHAASWWKHLKDNGYGWATINTVRKALKQVDKERKTAHRVWVETFNEDKETALAAWREQRAREKVEAVQAEPEPEPQLEAKVSAFATLLEGRDAKIPAPDDAFFAPIRYQKKIAAAVVKILKTHGYWEAFSRPDEDGDINFHLSIDNEPYMRFVIERHGNMVSLTHYGEQNGDAMRDPEMCFALPEWRPTMFQNDYAGYYSEDIPENDSFPATWAENLLQQGFADPKQAKASSLTHPRGD